MIHNRILVKFIALLSVLIFLLIFTSTTYWVFGDVMKEKAAIVILGDSHVHQIDGVTNLSWSEALQGHDVIGLGFNGYTSGLLLDGQHHPLQSAIDREPELVVIVIGANDAGNWIDSESTMKNIRIIREKLAGNSIEVMFTTIPPVSDDFNNLYGKGHLNNDIETLNNRIKAFCKESSCHIFDLHALLTKNNSDDTICLNKEYTVDGLHLSQKGYKIWYDGLRKELNEISRRE